MGDQEPKWIKEVSIHNPPTVRKTEKMRQLISVMAQVNKYLPIKTRDELLEHETSHILAAPPSTIGHVDASVYKNIHTRKREVIVSTIARDSKLSWFDNLKISLAPVFNRRHFSWPSIKDLKTALFG